MAESANKMSLFDSQTRDFYKNFQQCLQEDIVLAIVHTVDILDGVQYCHKRDGTRKLYGELIILN